VLDPPLSTEEWGSFDLVHTRFLLEHVPDSLAVVRMMVRAARPDGRIVLADDDHDLLRLWPELPRVDEVWRAYLKTYSHFGNDEFIGRKLVSLLHEAGATPVRNTIVFFGSCAGHESWTIAMDNLVGVLQGASETIVRIGAATSNSIAHAIEDLRQWSRLPQAALWYGICWAEGRRPA
jgi:SAM-dependent methyltransferase